MGDVRVTLEPGKLETVIVDFYRCEFRRRYQLRYMRRVSEFKQIPDDILEGLRDFFLDHLYPPLDVRGQMEGAFEHLVALLRSPARIRPLVRPAFMSVLRLSTQLPSVISMGLVIMDALRTARVLEGEMVKNAHKIGLQMADTKDRKKMLTIIGSVREKTMDDLYKNLFRLFEAFSNVSMVNGMLHVVERSVETMEERPDVYSAQEAEDLSLALDVLRDGHALFAQLRHGEVTHIIAGIQRIEADWYAGILQEAGLQKAAE